MVCPNCKLIPIIFEHDYKNKKVQCQFCGQNFILVDSSNIEWKPISWDDAEKITFEDGTVLYEKEN